MCLDRLDTIIPSQEAPGISDSLSGDEDLKINKPSSLSLEENESVSGFSYRSIVYWNLKVVFEIS